MDIIKHYKKANYTHVSQGFHDAHKAIDIAFKMGTFLVAPEDCRISVIVTDKNFDESLTSLSRGYGIGLWSLDGRRKYSEWHCMGIFPVNVGDIVKKGQPIAMMGNSGFVKSGGKIVSLEDRYKLPFRGVHTHSTMKIDNVLVDRRKYIDWGLPVEYSFMDWIRATTNILSKMSGLLPK